MTFDGKAFGAEIVGVVKGHVERALAPLNARIDAMEKAIPSLPIPKDGNSITIDDVAPMIKSEVERVGSAILDAAKASVAELVAAIPPAVNGKDADVDEVVALVAEKMAPDLAKMRADLDALNPQIEAIGAAVGEEIAEHVDKALAISEGKLLQQCNEMIDKRVEIVVAALPPAEKGKDADPVEVAAQIATEVERAVAALPVPKDGQSVTLDDMRPLIDEAVTKAVTLIPVPKDGKDGRDGLDVVKFIRDDRGHLNGILRDGTTVDLGEYVGKDGAPGKDGTDGVGFDDMEFVHDGERTFTFRFAKGDRTVEKSFDVPMMIYRGVYREGEKYKQGDTCTWGGHLWHCDTATKDKPDGKDRCWSMAVRKGKDGKDGELKPPTKHGPVKAD